MTCTLDGLPDTLWHGTSLHNARAIATTGMLGTASFQHPSRTAVCLTPDRATAAFFAMSKTRSYRKKDEKGRPVLIAVPREALDPKRLRCDFNLLAAPFGPVVRPALYTTEDFQTHFRRHQGRSARHWRHSLDTVNGFIHGGPIPLDTIQCDFSVMDMPRCDTDAEINTLEREGIFPKGWSLSEPQYHTITPSGQDPRLHTRSYITYHRNIEDAAHAYIHAALGRELGMAPHAITHSYPVHKLDYDAGTQHIESSKIHAAFHRALTDPGAPLFMLPAQGRELGGRAIVPTLMGITKPKKHKSTTLTFHLRTDMVWIHPDRLPQYHGQAAAAYVEMEAA